MSLRFRSRQPGRKAGLLITTGIVLLSLFSFTGPARADDSRPVDETTAEVIAEEAAAMAEVTPPASDPGTPGDPILPPAACGDAGTHYIVSHKQDLHIPVVNIHAL